MGKERQTGTLLVEGKVKSKGNGFKDGLGCHTRESLIASVLTSQLS